LALNIYLAFGVVAFNAQTVLLGPILNELARDFDVTLDEIASVITNGSVGYAVALILVAPLGDLLPRRSLVIWMSLVVAAATLGRGLSRNLFELQLASLLAGFGAVASMLFFPIIADLAPPERIGSALGIALSGRFIGLLAGRVYSGAIAEYASWPISFYSFSIIMVLYTVSAFFLLPDIHPVRRDLTYFGLLKSMFTLFVECPIIFVLAFVNCNVSAIFSAFWTVSTFLLGNFYGCNPFEIGLLALIGLAGALLAPFMGKLSDRIGPFYSMLLGNMITTLAILLLLFAGQVHIAFVVVGMFLLDVGIPLTGVGSQTLAFDVDKTARNRISSLLLLGSILGFGVGASASSNIFVVWGWQGSMIYAVASCAVGFIAILIPGPHGDFWGISHYRRRHIKDNPEGNAENQNGVRHISGEREE